MSKQRKISDVMNVDKLVCLPPQTSVSSASRKMFETKVGAVMVTSGRQLLGIVTECDINRRVVALGRNSAITLLSDIMTHDPDTLSPRDQIGEALDMMESNGYRHVPVEEKGAVIGIVSLRDLFHEVKQELEQDIHEREEYMFGSGYSVPVYAH